QSGSDVERRIAIGREQERIGCNPEPPAEHSDDEVEEGTRIATRKQYREPGNNDAEERQDAEEPQDDVVRNRQEPLDERQPAIQVVPGDSALRRPVVPQHPGVLLRRYCLVRDTVYGSLSAFPLRLRRRSVP